jgi:biopolymer transport protein ExbD
MLRKHRTSVLFSTIDATAFASVLVVLWLVVWLAGVATNNPHSTISADLPKTTHAASMPGALREDAMKITITRDDRVWFGTDAVYKDDDLAEKIQQRLKDPGIERKVYILVDMRARWDAVRAVLGSVRSAGILRVAFLVNQRTS